jgi:NAD(P)-dependent dehydrogenase (short-subunit alcohol dehydrogenase family)
VSRPAFPILVLGGYGVFGSRVVRLLARDPGLCVIIAGRDPDKARALAREIEGSEAPTTLETLAIDGLGADLAQRLAASGAKLVINAAGPFQGQDYRVPQACIAAGLHYLDLADSQDFVAGFADLDRAAREAGVTAVTGASTVPALSSAVIDALKPGFARLDALDIAISPGNRAPRGRALVAAILKTAGKPLPRWQDGAWTTVRGWHDLGRRTIAAPGLGSLGPRWLSACDAPDTLLFPERYGGVRRVRFRAGVELGVLHLGLWALSWLPALGLIGSLEPLAGPCRAASTLLLPLGSDRGGMVVELGGAGPGAAASLVRRWTLIAEAGDGPWVPAVPAVILARRLAAGEALRRGAMACLGLITLAEFQAATAHLAIGTAVEEEETAPPCR